MVDRGQKKNSSQQPDEYYPTPTSIPAGTRCLTLEIPDSAEWYGMALGALWELMRIQNYEKVGIDIDLVVDRWLEVFRTMEVDCMATVPVGATMMWHMAAPPDRWLVCGGQMVAKSDYPELWALWGDTFGASSPTDFYVLNMTDRSPYGQSGFLALNAAAGALTHTLTIAEMPSHNHRIKKASATASSINTVLANARTDNPIAPDMLTDNTGGGQAHPILHPVRGVNYIVYAGRAP